MTSIDRRREQKLVALNKLNYQILISFYLFFEINEEAEDLHSSVSLRISNDSRSESLGGLALGLRLYCERLISSLLFLVFAQLD